MPSAAAANPCQRRKRHQEAGCVEGEREREAPLLGEPGGLDRLGRRDGGDPDHQARERRPDEQRKLRRSLYHRVGGREVAGPHEPGHDGGLGGIEEGVGQSERERQRIHRDQMGLVEVDDQREAPDQEHARGVGRQHHALRRQPIGDGAAEQHERRARYRADREHTPHRERIARELQHEPGQRDQVELVAQERDRFADPEQPEVADAQDPRQRCPAAGRLSRSRHSPSRPAASASSALAPRSSVASSHA